MRKKVLTRKIWRGVLIMTLIVLVYVNGYMQKSTTRQNTDNPKAQLQDDVKTSLAEAK